MQDKFYTCSDTAHKCIRAVSDINSFDTIVEPSAGNGEFVTAIQEVGNFNILAFDIEPENDSICKMDWFDITKINGYHKLIIGNPPFGKRSMLAKRFIEHAIFLGAETIAFILPDTFLKVSNQSIFPDNWKLIKCQKIKDNAFYYDDKSYDIPCSFFIWTRKDSVINLREQRFPKSTFFVFCKRGDPNADFCINGNNGIVKQVNQVTNEKAEHYIKSVNVDKEILMKIFQNIHYDFQSSVSGKNAWIGQNEILKAFYLYMENNKDVMRMRDTV